jgi:hypothetical protein
MKHGSPALAAGLLLLATPAAAQSIEELQRQIDELRATVLELKSALAARDSSQPAQPPAQAQATPPAAPAIVRTAAAQTPDAPPPRAIAWYERITLRGYTQVRLNKIISGDATAPAGQSRLRSIGDGAITDRNNFSLRRVRLILQGDINDYAAIYIQPDFATNVVNQAAGERREGFGQLRDAYVDIFPTGDKSLRLRVGQSKVPFGWENLQSSSSRLALDRTDGINSAVPTERDLGVNIYYTPRHVQRIWDRLTADGQKMFGNYGAFGLALYNGQGTNRVEANNGLMAVAMATWPFELDSLGLSGQVLELGAVGYRNRVRPELRSGGTSAIDYADERVGVHAILYPQPFGLQAEWNWGRGPEWDTATQSIQEKPLQGGYIQAMYRVRQSPLGPFMPFARWQHYRGGFKAGLNAPRLETDELELGIEFQPTPPIELTLSYGNAKRREPDERRQGRAEGELLRAQLQFNY